MIVPILSFRCFPLLLSAWPRAVPSGVVFVDGEGGQEGLDARQHALADDGAGRAGDGEEEVAELERGEREPVVLRGELARFTGDEFLFV